MCRRRCFDEKKAYRFILPFFQNEHVLRDYESVFLSDLYTVLEAEYQKAQENCLDLRIVVGGKSRAISLFFLRKLHNLYPHEPWLWPENIIALNDGENMDLSKCMSQDNHYCFIDDHMRTGVKMREILQFTTKVNRSASCISLPCGFSEGSFRENSGIIVSLNQDFGREMTLCADSLSAAINRRLYGSL